MTSGPPESSGGSPETLFKVVAAGQGAYEKQPLAQPLHSEEEQLAGTKRKVPERKKTFKIVGHLVMAMQRFKASLNPTYTYGKRPDSSLSSGSRPASALNMTSDAEGPVTAQASAEAPPRAYRRTTSGGSSRGGADSEATPRQERYAYPTRGHKTDYLFKPLPPAPGEAALED